MYKILIAEGPFRVVQLIMVANPWQEVTGLTRYLQVNLSHVPIQIS